MNCKKCEFVEEVPFLFGSGDYNCLLYCNRYFCLTKIAKKNCDMKNKENIKIYFAHSRLLYFTPEEELIEYILKMRGYTIENPRDFGMDEDDKKVVDFDFNKMKSCDQVLCLFLHQRCNSNIGAVCEMNWAMELKKKLIVVADFYHPFLDKFADEYYLSLQKFKNDIQFKKK